MRIFLLIFLVGVFADGSLAQSRAIPPPQSSLSDQQRLALLDVEDGRAPDAVVMQLLGGVNLVSPETQRLAVRMLGRLERPQFIPRIVSFLTARSAAVRGEAANALAQALHVENPDPSDVRVVTRALLDALRLEREKAVSGIVARSLGRLPFQSAVDVQDVERAMVGLLERISAASPPTGIEDVEIAFESLFARTRTLQPPSDQAIHLLKGIVTLRTRGVPRIPAFAALIAAAQVDDDLLDSVTADPDVEIKRLSAGVLRAIDPAANPHATELIDRLLADSDENVRYAALRAYAAHPVKGCEPAIRLLGDEDERVVLLAIDTLAGSCTSEQNIAEILNGYVLNVPQTRNWHRAAHALVALAARDSERASAAMPGFTDHAVANVRMYAARAAFFLKDLDRLKQFAASDADDNVRQTAIVALNALVRHDADEIYRAVLRERGDYQLLMTAANALEGTQDRTATLAALLDALARVTRDRRETSREVRLALLKRLRELGPPSDASRLRPYVTDFDPFVAREAAALLSVWTGVAIEAKPQPLPRVPLPTMEELRGLERMQVEVAVQGVGAFTLTLHVDDAPLTVVRFARLVDAKYYDGTIIHRVEPDFIVQGGSPGGNAYSGAERYVRDEVGLRLAAGQSVGMATRGRDTGDGQFFINMGDNRRLTHEYTIFASVAVRFPERPIVPRILEGDVIDHMMLVPKRP